MNETSPLTNNNSNSSTSSSGPNSLTEAQLKEQEQSNDQFQIAPILGLCSRPKHLLTPKELRKDIQSLREMRSNRSRFNQAAEGSAEGRSNNEAENETDEERKSKKEKAFEEFDEL
jgi:hypothetical protein